MNKDFHEDVTPGDVESSNHDTLVTEILDEDSSQIAAVMSELVPVESEDVERMRVKAIEIRRLRKKEIDLAPVLEQGKDRETELADMVLTLINSLQPAREQLLAQAETISRLSQQLNFLLTRSAEERERWRAEREGWDRTAETLISQAAKSGPSIYKDYYPSRQTAAADSDNQIMKQKYLEAQSRLSALEAELAQLKPLLLMRPFALTHSHLPLAAISKARKKVKENEIEIVEVPEDLTIMEDGPSTPKASKGRGQYYRKREEILPSGSPFFGSSKKQFGGSKTVNASGGIPIPMLSDARSEHLLLAARKIGKERASLLSAMVYHSSELKTPTTLKGKEKAEDYISSSPHPSHGPPSLRRPATPKTPRQAPTSMPYNAGGIVTPNVSPSRYPSDSDLGSAHVSHGPKGSEFRFLPGTKPRQSTGSPTRKGRPPGSGKASSSKLSLPNSSAAAHTEHGSQFINWQSQTNNNTPTQSTSHEYQSSSAKQLVMPVSPTPTSSKRSSAPRTPLDSLYSAARSVLSPMTSLEGRPPDLQEMSSQSQEKKSPGKRRERAVDDPFVIENEEQLLSKSKRRRTETIESYLSQASQSQHQIARGSRERTLSALDVLADQAMVFSTSGISSHTGPSMPSPLRSTHTLDSEKADSGDVGGDIHNDDRIGSFSNPPRHDRNGRDDESVQLMEKDKAREGADNFHKIDEIERKDDASREDGVPISFLTSNLNKPLSSSVSVGGESENVLQRSERTTSSSSPIVMPGLPTDHNDLAHLPGLGARTSGGNDQDKTLIQHDSAFASPPPDKSNSAEDVRLRWLKKLGM